MSDIEDRWRLVEEDTLMFAEEELRLKRMRAKAESEQLALEVAQMQTEVGATPDAPRSEASGPITGVTNRIMALPGSAKNVVTATAKLPARAFGGGKPSRTDNAVISANQVVPIMDPIVPVDDGCDAARTSPPTVLRHGATRL